MKKVISLILVFVLAAAALVGCAKKDDDWSYIKGKGTMVIGYTDYEPMNFTDKSGQARRL